MSSKLAHYKRGAKCSINTSQNSGFCSTQQRSKHKEPNFFTFREMEMPALRIAGIDQSEEEEEEVALRISTSFKKRNPNVKLRERFDGKNAKEESTCEAERKVTAALLSLKFLASRDSRLVRWKALYSGGQRWGRTSESRIDKSKLSPAVLKWARMGRMAAKVTNLLGATKVDDLFFT